MVVRCHAPVTLLLTLSLLSSGDDLLHNSTARPPSMLSYPMLHDARESWVCSEADRIDARAGCRPAAGRHGVHSGRVALLACVVVRERRAAAI
ncbi:hypothetical protein CCR75_005519 [Bremia lactucae]|uniref:Secreted protein n=1 Tax=Bremia lactucae TaxID=4779 RepID=A0A976FGE5_BRELC|nr:hypothetical protein CCR75_005519 [Bremia lactucae]